MATSGGNNGNGNGSKLPTLTEDTVKDLLAVQKQELAIRLEEVKRDNAETSLKQSVARQSIEAQERDRKHDREEVTKRIKSHQRFLLLIVLMTLFFVAYALHIGKTEIVMDLAKLAFGFAAGMGYQAFRARQKNKDDDSAD